MRRGAVGAVAILALASAAGCGDTAPPELESTAEVSAAQFVGRAACVECHPQEVAAFEASHHDLAMSRPDLESLPADFAAVLGLDGEVAWTLGIEPLQQLLIAGAGGRYQAFGLAWDAREHSEGGQRWYPLFPDVEPGDPLHWTGYEQTANHQCLECHTTGFAKAYDLAKDAYATHWAEDDVSCEACHGPASGHVAWARGSAPEADPTRGFLSQLAGPGQWIFEGDARVARRPGPAPASSEQVDVCARCHSRRERFADDDRPDLPLLHAHRPALLVPELYHADGQPREEVYVWGSFLQSRMATAGVVCSDCHEPHSLRLRAEGNALCGTCHRADVFDTPAHHHHAPDSEGAQCANCHMPETLFMGVDARREHAFRIPRPDRSEALETRDACTDCHSERSPEWAAQNIEAWFGPARPPVHRYPEAFASAWGMREDAAERLLEVLADPAEPAIARASAVRALAPLLDAGNLPALEAALRDSEPLVRLAAVEAAQRLPPEARLSRLRPLLDDPQRAIRVGAARALAGLPAERLPAPVASSLARATAELSAGAARNADRPEAHLELANLARLHGDLEAAHREIELALRIDPELVPAAVNRADLYREQERDDLGEQVLRSALAARPENPELLHALGLLLVRQGRLEAAGEALSRAAELAPDGRFAYAYGLFLIDRGERSAGLQRLERALAARPGDRELLYALASLYRDAGERDKAVHFARRLVAASPGDPGAAGFLRALETE